MPEPPGLRTTTTIQLRAKRANVLIAVTGWKKASDKILANLAGFDHHVAKPYDPNELLKLLAKIPLAAR